VTAVAAFGMLAYGLHQVGVGVDGMTRGTPLEAWATAALVLLGSLLIVSAIIVYLGVPGALAAALGSLLGLQALAIHNAVHLSPSPESVGPHLVRGAFSATLVLLAWAGDRQSSG
jgi:fatty acid desaturase